MERFTQESVKRTMKEEEAGGRRQKYLVVINPVSRGGKAIKEGLWLLKQMGRRDRERDPQRHDVF